MGIHVVPLGAGQDVGRSCLLLTIGGRNIMLDCGMHMGYHDARRFPDFSFISRTGRYTESIDALIISHFHLDHCGALPFFTEKCGYDGPIYMTAPTRAICPILLEDSRGILQHGGDAELFSSQDIKNCMKKVTAVCLRETVHVDDELEVKAYYAGHVLGAAMFHIRVGSESVVYTGDFNMTSDRHLGAAWIDRCKPDLLITESTYATRIRESRMEREADFLRSVHECVKGGGRVLIPCFALGRAQELCMLLEAYWERTQLSCPIYFSSSMTGKSTEYYKRFISWLNPALRDNFREGKRNPFDYKHITKFDKSYHEKPGPMVLFSTPGMLHSGNSLEVFKMWAPDPKNMLIIPGYCVPGTIGGQLMSGKREVTIDKRKLEVNLQVRTLSFSAHADAKGIKQLIANCRPRNVMLVHGEKPGMVELAGELTANGIPTYFPRNGDTVYITTPADVPVEMSPHFLKRALAIGGLRGTERAPGAEDGARRRKESPKAGCRSAVPFDGIVVVDESAGGDANPGKGGKGPHRLVDASEVPDLVDMPRQRFLVSSRLAFDPSTVAMVAAQCNLLPQVAAGEGPLDAADAALAVLFSALKSTLGAAGVRVFPGLAADSRRPDRLYVGEEAMEIYRLDALPPHEGDPRLFRELWLEDGWDAKFWEGEGAAARAAGVEELGVRWSEDSGTIAERAVRIAEDALRGDKLYPRVHPAGPLGARER